MVATPPGPARGVPSPTESRSTSRAAVPSVSASHHRGLPRPRVPHSHRARHVAGGGGKGGKQVLGDRSAQHTPGLPKPLGTCPFQGQTVWPLSLLLHRPPCQRATPCHQGIQNLCRVDPSQPSGQCSLISPPSRPPYLFPGFLLT
uniref:Uncharacterized protein n=1 Tax=Myotis myotis TaxID=51298 RepID=A0A7J7WHJ5_MYOMY|nr:hypothetical protein mMyoMyo1_012089 [Myotis myotis]